MKISLEKPPCYEEANKFFKLEELNLGTIFTYGDTLYNPNNVPLTQDLIVHEMVHSEQQAHSDTGGKLWWQMYLADPEFRLKQEIEAYGAQYRYICTIQKDRNAQARTLHKLSKMLAGPMYGTITSSSEASKLIREYATNTPKKKSITLAG